MRLLAFSDLHTDLGQAQRLAESSAQVDVVVGVGDFASVHSGLEETIDALGAIEAPAVLVPGNNETEQALREACANRSRPRGAARRGDCGRRRSLLRPRRGRAVTPWDWSFDLSEEAAAEMLEACPEGCVLAVHSPPRGHVDVAAPATTWAAKRCSARSRQAPRLALCGHVHESWGQESEIGPTRVINLGPQGMILEVEPVREV